MLKHYLENKGISNLLDPKEVNLVPALNTLVKEMLPTLNDNQYQDVDIIHTHIPNEVEIYHLNYTSKESIKVMSFAIDNEDKLSWLNVMKCPNYKSEEGHPSPGAGGVRNEVLLASIKDIGNDGFSMTIGEVKEINTFLKQFFMRRMVKSAIEVICDKYKSILSNQSITIKRTLSQVIPDINTLCFTLNLKDDENDIISSLFLGVKYNHEEDTFEPVGVLNSELVSVMDIEHLTTSDVNYQWLMLTPEDTMTKLHELAIPSELVKRSLYFNYHQSPIQYTLQLDSPNFAQCNNLHKLFNLHWFIDLNLKNIDKLSFRVRHVDIDTSTDRRRMHVEWEGVNNRLDRKWIFNESVYVDAESIGGFIRQYVEDKAAKVIDKMIIVL